jgi:hypothetical protein
LFVVPLFFVILIAYDLVLHLIPTNCSTFSTWLFPMVTLMLSEWPVHSLIAFVWRYVEVRYAVFLGWPVTSPGRTSFALRCCSGTNRALFDGGHWKVVLMI